MWIRLPGAEYKRSRGDLNRRAFKTRVRKGPPPGLLAYVKGRPAAWCAVAPRPEYRRLERSRVLKPIDDRPVWSTPCFFVAPEHRGAGLTSVLLKAAARYAKARGARVLEGYPVDTRGKRTASAFIWWGTSKAFSKAGFREAARRSRSRPIMRRSLS